MENSENFVRLGQHTRRKLISGLEQDYFRESLRTSRSSKNFSNTTVVINKLKIHAQEVHIYKLRRLQEKPQTLTCGTSFLKSSQIGC